MQSKKALNVIHEIVGDQLFEQIISELAGTTVYFPEKYEWTNKLERNTSIKEDYYSGDYEIRDLADKYNLSISRIYKIVQGRE